MKHDPDIDGAGSPADAGGAEETQHPAAEALVAYCDGELAEPAAEAIEDHLTECQECAALVADLTGFRGTGFVAERPLSEFERAASWRALERRLADPAPAPAAHSPVARPPAVRHSAQRWLRLAAGLTTVSTLGLGAWNLSQQAQINRLSQPQLATAYEQINLGTGKRSGNGAGPELAAGAREGSLALTLVVPDDEQYPNYRIEIEAETDQHVWTLEGRPQIGGSTFFLTLPRRTFQNGSYLLRVSGLDGAGPHLIDEKSLVIH